MRLDRRLSGLLVLVIGLLVAVVVPRALNNSIAGAGSRAPLPPPPPVGSCLTLEAPLTEETFWGTLPFVLPDFQVVDCSEPHDVEISESWVADGPFIYPEGPDYPCQESWLEYLGWDQEALPDPWQIAFFSANIGVVQAPDSQRLAGRGWFACAVTPYPFSRTTGSAGYLAEILDRPAGFGNCLMDQQPVSCETVHTDEVLAYAYGQEADDPTIESGEWALLPSEEVMLARCQELAAVLMKRTDPTFEGAITVHLDYEVRTLQEIYIYHEEGDAWLGSEPVIGTYSNATCSLTTTDSSPLIDSLVGIGDKPLPVQ